MKTVYILLEEFYNEHELWYPYWRLIEAGHKPVLVDTGRLAAYPGRNGGLMAKADISMDEAEATNADGLIIPGGFAPDFLRRYEPLVNLARNFDLAKKPLGAICHGGWMLCSAGILKNGRRATSFSGIKDDMINAGAHWSDEAVVTDGHLVTSRKPEDMPAFMKVFLSLLAG